ncbi:YigZ family protein [Gulosibacter molinativorax]|uniref:YigZ family protein n=1 Tax=Gulosibacter molinativorax TaxID=256821 RepID=A0ABT7C7Q7_9MICO|nr:YigZ family protein [Gulosibacter molinativorax]MDJ1371100.1 YigZ family protein [Gulosibacter molinativorax]QUY61460.1 YigZ family protein [Gulosibacter molinativorax]
MSDVTRATRYGVLAADADHEIEIKRSRFICYLSRVEDESEARDFVGLVRAEHRLARHHCTAFVIGADRMVQRSNDDGEPSGTAGLPMLEALTLFTRPGESAADLSDTIAVVVRYFGGVLLGAGGLVRAYSDAVSQALGVAEFRTRQRMRLLTLPAPHADAGRWENELRAADIEVIGTDYEAADAILRLAVTDEAQEIETVAHRVAALTQGRGTLGDAGVSWVDLTP